MTGKKGDLKREFRRNRAKGVLQRIGKKRHRLVHGLFVLFTVGGYLAGDYAQDGVIDGSLLQTMLPYLQVLI